jgi:hypothetical protein
VKTGFIALLQLLPVLLSTLLIAAHFLRYGNLLLALLCLAVPLLLLVRRPPAVWLVQLALFLAALEWIRTTAVLVAQRSHMGLPWVRLSAILGAVAVFTLGSLFVFLSKTLRTRYNLT